MAVFFKTKNPRDLLQTFNDRIEQEEKEGKITTWHRNSTGDYTHKAAQWQRKAWFRPVVIEATESVEPMLRFNLIPPKDSKIDRVTWGYYHGHLTETFLNHFENFFTYAISSAKPMIKRK